MTWHIIILFAKGLLTGFLFALPIGPVGLLCIKRTLQKGFFPGMATGLGAAVADAFYGAVAAFGLRAIADFLNDLQKPIRFIGAVLLLALAWKAWTAKTGKHEVATESKFKIGVFISTLTLALTNPATIIAFTIVFANLGFADSSNSWESAAIVSGVFSGSMLWWASLSGIISIMRSEAILNNMKWINRIAAVLLLVFAVWALVDLFYVKMS